MDPVRGLRVSSRGNRGIRIYTVENGFSSTRANIGGVFAGGSIGTGLLSGGVRFSSTGSVG